MERRAAAVLALALLLAGCADGPRASVQVAAEPPGRLSVHPVLRTSADATPTDPAEVDPTVGATVPDPDGGPAIALGPAVLTGDDVARAMAEPLRAGGPADGVTVEWSQAGAVRWAELTGRAACAAPGDPARRIAVLLDGEVVSAPVVSPAVLCDVGVEDGLVQLLGPLPTAQAERLAARLRPDPR